MIKKYFLLLLFVYCCTTYAAEKDNHTCGIQYGSPLTNAYGPIDYTDPTTHKDLHIVLDVHFTPSVERLISGNAGYLAADLDYTLRAIPNYHRALYAISKYEKSLGHVPKTAHAYSAECYFKRAIYFQPRDPTSLMLYGMHLHGLKLFKQAELQYKKALALHSDGAEINYNLGLLYIEMKDFVKAQFHADKAYAAGYPLQGLNNKLHKNNKIN